MFDLKGKTALITGSGQGIGRETALLLAAQGAKVIINWRSRDEIAMETIKELEKAVRILKENFKLVLLLPSAKISRHGQRRTMCLWTSLS